MTVDDQARAIEDELDSAHQSAQAHFRNRDVSAYIDMFAPDLVYKQANGAEIGREQLRRDVAAQLSRMVSSDSSYTRESLCLEGDDAVEHLLQTASATVRVFGVFRRSWKVQRSGRYFWRKMPTGWKIRRVEVLDERIGGGAA